MSALKQKAMLVTLNTSTWTARKHDRKISQEVATNHDAADFTKVGRYNKLLIDKSKLEAVQKAATAARLHHLANTMPWENNGSRLLPVMNYQAYTTEQRKLQEAFSDAADVFALHYPEYVEESRARLNGLFNADDYPAAGAIRWKFRMETSMMPMPDAQDFRVDLNDAEVKRIQDDIGRTVQKRLQTASDDLWQRLYDAVLHIHERLSAFKDGESKRLHATIITNLTELTGLLTHLNFTDDPNLEKMRQKIEFKLCRYDIEALRHSESARVESATATADILKQMSAYMGDA